MSMDNAIALVVGASVGIGRAISFELLQSGADVFMLGRNITKLTLPDGTADTRYTSFTRSYR
jgi:NADP-dependent 3-hydroxy acid dehydrogenase YdfG